MPAIAVGAAVYAGSALAIGASAMSTMAVISAVGAVAAGVGTVTGNKDLVKIGAIAGLAGGIGAYAQGQGWMDATTAIDEAGLAGDYVNQMDQASDIAAQASTPIPTAPSYQPPTTDESQVMNGTWDQAQTPPVTQVAPPSGLVNSNTNNINGLDLTPTQSAAVQAGYIARKPPVTSRGIFDVLKDVGTTLSENKELASLGLNFVGGMFDKKKEAEANAANASVDWYKARASGELLNQDQQRQQMANANAIPDLTSLKIKQGSLYGSTTPPVYTAPRIGLMNSTGR